MHSYYAFCVTRQAADLFLCRLAKKTKMFYDLRYKYMLFQLLLLSIVTETSKKSCIDDVFSHYILVEMHQDASAFTQKICDQMSASPPRKEDCVIGSQCVLVVLYACI